MKPLILLVAIGILVWGNPTAADDPKAIKTKVRLGVDGDLVAAKATKIMIIRHAEKPPSSPPPDGVNVNGDHDANSLIVRGWQRAGGLAVFFAPANGSMHNPGIATPQFIYATRVGKESESERQEETVTPLIEVLKDRVAVNFDFLKGQEPQVAASALACAGTVLISWEHHTIPAIASKIPLSPNNTTPVPSLWPDDRFDLVWVFDLDPGASGYFFNQVPQLLLAGDRPV